MSEKDVFIGSNGVMKKKQTLTIFTPLYNRKSTLKRTYESLKRQTCKDFEWLIIDDGSTDNPFEEIEKWQHEDNGFVIRYIYKENGGMHTAHNVAYENITTELNTCIDSDDYMPDNAVELIVNCWNQCRDKGYAGIIALDYADSTKNVIGKELPYDRESISLSDYYYQGGEGDKKLIYRTDIINQTPPYPVFEGEKYVSLAYKYQIIDQTYEMKILNANVCFVEYQLDGSSTNMYRQYMNNPRGFAFWRTEQMKYSRSISQKYWACIHYSSSSLICNNRRFIKESPCKLLTVLAIPFGFVLTILIRIKSKKSYYNVKI